MKKLFFSLFLIIIFSGIVVAQSENSSGCQKFKMTIITPPESTNFKLVVKRPDEKFEFKGVVIDPCKVWALPQKPQYPYILQWTPLLPHPFIELSRKPKPKNSNNVPRLLLLLPEGTKRLIGQ